MSAKIKHPDRAIAAVLRTLERDHGCEVRTPGQSKHWKVFRDGVLVASVSCTSGQHAVSNLRRELRRYHGIEV